MENKKSVKKLKGATAAKKIKPGKSLYTRISDENKAWVAKKGYETGHSTTTIVNKAIECVRTGAKFELGKYEPKYLRRAMESRANRLNRLKAAAGEAISA